jgi:hypothetical protein
MFMLRILLFLVRLLQLHQGMTISAKSFNMKLMVVPSWCHNRSFMISVIEPDMQI